MPHQPAHGGSTPPEGKLNCFITGADTRSAVAGKSAPENDRPPVKLFLFFRGGEVGCDYFDLSALGIGVCVFVCFFSFLTDREILYAVTSLRSITFYSRSTFRKQINAVQGAFAF